VIGTLFRFAQRRGYLPKDWDELDRLEKVKVKGIAVEVFTSDEMTRLLKAAPEKFVPVLAIGGFAGLRSAEIERLDWQELRLAERFIEVTAGKAKTASRRLVPISDNLSAWLAPFASSEGQVWPQGHDARYDAQQDTARAAGIKWKANGLRHSFISYRLAQIQNVNQVAMEAGNSPSVIHTHYRKLVRPADAARWFSIAPISNENILRLPATA
jgi:integrase